MPDEREARFLPRTLARTAGLGLAVTALFGGGCHTVGDLKKKTFNHVRAIITSSYHDPEAEEKVTRADALFEDKDWEKAQELYADVANNTYNPVLLCEKARYQESECLRERGRLQEAIAHYNRLLQDFPAGAYREKTCGRIYGIAYKWLEDGTLKQIEDELAGKSVHWWETVRLPNFTDRSKPSVDQEGEALKYLEVVHTHDITGPTADKALFWCGYVHFYRGRYDDADHFFSQLVEMHKDSPLWQEGVKLAVLAKNNSTGGAVYDSQKASEALTLVHHAEATVPDYVADKDKAAWLMRQKLAIRMQLAEKDYQTARYYERTNHPASAYFVYELITRRYPGTKYSDLAAERLVALEKVREKIEADRAAGKKDGTWRMIEREWGRVMGSTPMDDDVTPAEPNPDKPPKSRPLDAPRALPPELTGAQ